MNKTHRIVWSESRQAWVVAHEKAAFGGRPGATVALSLALLLGMPAQAAPGATELPTSGQVVAGSAAIQTNGARMDVNQSTPRAAIDWQTFNIGAQAHVHFQQPTGGATLNRVLDTNASQIYGRLTATGQVFLTNPNGVFFAPGAQVDVGGLVASTLDITNDNFMAGKLHFEGASANAIINQGNITTAPGGTVALIAARIENTGSIDAPQGHVLMGAGNRVTLDLGGPVKIQVEEGVLDALIEQGGAIRADGGLVYLTARAANDLASAVINHTGITEARTLATGENGEIWLMGDMAHGQVNVAGTLDASAPNGGDGGFIETSAARVWIDPAVSVTTLSSQGKTGTWLIDPTDFTISTGSAAQTDSGIGATTLSTALNSNNVTIQTVASGGGYGDINVSAAVTKTTGPTTTLTLAAHRNINITQLIRGSAGYPLNVVLAARAFGGDTGYVNISGGGIRSFGGDITIGGGDIHASGFAINSTNFAGVRINNAVIDATGNGSGAANATLPTATSGGNIVIRGKGNLAPASTSYQWGVQTQNNVAIVTGGNGSISIEGHGGYGGYGMSSSWAVGSAGVVFESGSYVKANNGSITVKGYAGTGKDRYGIASTESSKLIGTNGQLLFEGDSLLIRNATLTIHAGQDSDIKMPIVGCTGTSGCAAYTFEKQGTGVLNLWGNAEHWNSNRPANTFATPTTGTFTDATNTVNVVGLTANQALYAFNTRPTTINEVSSSSANVILNYTFLPLTGSYFYNGNSYLLGDLWSASSLFGSGYSAWAIGTDYRFMHGGNPVTGFTNAGSYSNITVDILKSGYTVANGGNTAGSLTITPRPVTVTADAKSKLQGQPDPALTYTTGCGALTSDCGLVAGETLLGSLSRDAGEAPGDYAITQGTVTNTNNPNYAISYVGANLTIAAASSGGGSTGGTGGTGGAGDTGGNTQQPAQESAIASAQEVAAQAAADTGGTTSEPATATGSTTSAFFDPAASSQPTVTGAGDANLSLSGGLAFIEVSSAPSDAGGTGGGEGQGGAAPGMTLAQAGGLDPSGFMRVFVVQGGIRLPEPASATAGQNAGGQGSAGADQNDRRRPGAN